jgi:hypothetical protein
VIAYIKQLNESHTVDFLRARVMVVGGPMAGKTSLINSIINERFDDCRAVTNGVDIHEYKLHDLEISFLDFGGQSIYMTTHPMLFALNSIFIYVCHYTLEMNEEQMEREIHIYLQQIRDTCISSPLIVISTHSDSTGIRLTDRLLNCIKYYYCGGNDIDCKHADYGKFCGYYHITSRISNTDSHSDLRKLVNDLHDLTLSLDFVKKQIPKSYLTLRERIKELSLQHNRFSVSYDTFYNLANDCKINNKLRIDEVLKLFHEWGVCYALDIENGGDIVLNLEKLCDVINNLITASPTIYNGLDKFVKTGILHHSEDVLNKIWPNYNRTLHLQFIQLLHRSRLAFPVTSSDESVDDNNSSGNVSISVIPSMLPGGLDIMCGYNIENCEKLLRDAYLDPTVHLRPSVKIFFERSLPSSYFPRLITCLYKYIIITSLSKNYFVMKVRDEHLNTTTTTTNINDYSYATIILSDQSITVYSYGMNDFARYLAINTIKDVSSSYRSVIIRDFSLFMILGTMSDVQHNLDNNAFSNIVIDQYELPLRGLLPLISSKNSMERNNNNSNDNVRMHAMVRTSDSSGNAYYINRLKKELREYEDIVRNKLTEYVQEAKLNVNLALIRAVSECTRECQLANDVGTLWLCYLTPNRSELRAVAFSPTGMAYENWTRVVNTDIPILSAPEVSSFTESQCSSESIYIINALRVLGAIDNTSNEIWYGLTHMISKHSEEIRRLQNDYFSEYFGMNVKYYGIKNYSIQSQDMELYKLHATVMQLKTFVETSHSEQKSLLISINYKMSQLENYIYSNKISPVAFCLMSEKIQSNNNSNAIKNVSYMSNLYGMLSTESNDIRTRISNALYNKCYMYLMCEKCYTPQGINSESQVWPIEIRNPTQTALTFLPLGRFFFHAALALNTLCNLAYLFGIPVPRITPEFENIIKKELNVLSKGTLNDYKRIEEAVQKISQENIIINTNINTNITQQNNVVHTDGFCTSQFCDFIKRCDRNNEWKSFLIRTKDSKYVCRECYNNYDKELK